MFCRGVVDITGFVYPSMDSFTSLSVPSIEITSAVRITFTELLHFNRLGLFFAKPDRNNECYFFGTSQSVRSLL
jgi:hypothetical protein